MKKWVVFPCFSNEQLKEVILERAREIGYEGDPYSTISVSINVENGRIAWTDTYTISRMKENSNNYDDHELGDLEKLFTTDYYKFKKPLMINDYEVEFKVDGIQVGCQFVYKDVIKKIAEKFFIVSEIVEEGEPF